MKLKEKQNEFVLIGNIMKKKRFIAVIGIVGVVAAAAIGWHFLSDDKKDSQSGVFVQKVSDLTGNAGFVQRFSGVVEAQDNVNIDADNSKKIAEIYVQEGQEIKKGDPLFVYDTNEITNQIRSLQLDLEECDGRIAQLNADIKQLQDQINNGGDRTELTLQIQGKQMEINSAGYDKQSKQAEISRNQKEIDNATVKASIDGVVKAIHRDPANDNVMGEQTHFMQLTQTGEFRVKGNVDEQSMGAITAGQNVLIRSRIHEDEVWSGTVTAVEKEPASSGNNNSGMESGDTATKYPFYVSLNDSKELMLGQHVFIEPDMGQGRKKTGIWLDSSFLGYNEDGSAYVWKSVKGILKKEPVEVGDVDEETFTTEIKSGLSIDDEIAWPDETLQEGQKTLNAGDIS